MRAFPRSRSICTIGIAVVLPSLLGFTFLVAAVPAHATAAPTVWVDAGHLYVTGTPNSDILRYRPSDAAATSWIVSMAPGIVAGAGCAPFDAKSVECSGAISDLIAHLGDNGDIALSGTKLLPATIYGGAGNDSLSGSRSDDHIYGQAGFDTIEPRGGADVLSGGRGSGDAVSFGYSPAGVTVTVDGVANDGVPGEGSNVETDVERVYGSPFADTITSPDGWILTESGDDHLILTGSTGRLAGGDGNDTLDAGPSSAALYGEIGDDTINSQNGVANAVHCGTGVDVANIDALDHTDGKCETVNLGS